MQFITLAGFVLGILIVLGVSYWSVRKFRRHLSSDAFRRLYIQTLTRVAGWSVASYLVWFILISPVLYKFGVSVPRPK